jgi:hypothetical protein
MPPNSSQLLASQSNQPGPNIFDQKYGIHVKNATGGHFTGRPNHPYTRSAVSSPVTDNGHRCHIDIAARCSQSGQNLTVNRVFPMAIAEEEYAFKFHSIRIKIELFFPEWRDRYLPAGYDFVNLI